VPEPEHGKYEAADDRENVSHHSLPTWSLNVSQRTYQPIPRGPGCPIDFLEHECCTYVGATQHFSEERGLLHRRRRAAMASRAIQFLQDDWAARGCGRHCIEIPHDR
jgi:hypothetical protein